LESKACTAFNYRVEYLNLPNEEKNGPEITETGGTFTEMPQITKNRSKKPCFTENVENIALIYRKNLVTSQIQCNYFALLYGRWLLGFLVVH
jgi:hypothetical protein